MRQRNAQQKIDWEQLGNLKDMVIGGITSFVVDMVVTKAVPKIISMALTNAARINL